MRDRRRAHRAERRGARRTPFVAAVREEAGPASGLALAQDLGPHGMRLRRAERLVASSVEPSSRTFSFELPDGGALLRLRGAVVFERAEGRFQAAGVRFVGLSAGDRARISAFVDHHPR